MSDQTSTPPALDDQFCYAIYSAGMAIQRVYTPFLDQLGLTYPQYSFSTSSGRKTGRQSARSLKD